MREAFAVEAFALQKLLTFYQQKILAFLRINKTLTNDVVSFEQLGPGVYAKRYMTFVYQFLHLCGCILKCLYVCLLVTLCLIIGIHVKVFD